MKANELLDAVHDGKATIDGNLVTFEVFGETRQQRLTDKEIADYNQYIESAEENAANEISELQSQIDGLREHIEQIKAGAEKAKKRKASRKEQRRKND